MKCYWYYAVRFRVVFGEGGDEECGSLQMVMMKWVGEH